MRTPLPTNVARQFDADVTARLLELRRAIHANPELSFHENRTAERLEQALASFGVDAVERVATTGVVARVRGRRPDAPVVAVSGDGGFLFTAQELATAVQHGIPTVTVVFDDGAYGNSNRDQQEKFGGRELGTLLRNPDWVQLAGAFGADGMVVSDIAHLGPAIRDACTSPHPTVIAVPMERLPSPF